MGKWTRRGLLAGASGAAGLALGRFALAPSNDPGPAYPSVPAGTGGAVLDDASELSPTRVARHVVQHEPFEVVRL